MNIWDQERQRQLYASQKCEAEWKAERKRKEKEEKELAPVPPRVARKKEITYADFLRYAKGKLTAQKKMSYNQHVAMMYSAGFMYGVRAGHKQMHVSHPKNTYRLEKKFSKGTIGRKWIRREFDTWREFDIFLKAFEKGFFTEVDRFHGGEVEHFAFDAGRKLFENPGNALNINKFSYAQFNAIVKTSYIQYKKALEDERKEKIRKEQRERRARELDQKKMKEERESQERIESKRREPQERKERLAQEERQRTIQYEREVRFQECRSRVLEYHWKKHRRETPSSTTTRSHFFQKAGASIDHDMAREEIEEQADRLEGYDLLGCSD
jgi:hypothetical protein